MGYVSNCLIDTKKLTFPKKVSFYIVFDIIMNFLKSIIKITKLSSKILIPIYQHFAINKNEIKVEANENLCNIHNRNKIISIKISQISKSRFLN